MKISTVSIIGDGGLASKIQKLLEGADFTVTISDLSGDYAKQAVDVDLVLEVANEDLALKKKVFKNCDAKCRREAILATITANPWVTQLARVTERPEKVVGLNFTENPFEERYLVQIIRGLQTSDATVQAVKEFLEKVGVTAVKLEENPGLILDRVIASIVNEAAVMYSSKLATKEDIDKAMKLGSNYQEGPFETINRLGLDIVREELKKLQQEYGHCYSLPKMLQ